MVAAGLGNSPWTVFADGLGDQTGLSIGLATVVISFVILLLWIPLRQRPGLGTIANAIIVGVGIDVLLLVVGEPEALAAQVAFLLLGIGLVGIGSGIYLGVALGPGPRDGLMTGLHRLTGRPVAPIRIAIELSALLAGYLLGGTAGAGTVAFAVLVGPAVALGMRFTGAVASEA